MVEIEFNKLENMMVAVYKFVMKLFWISNNDFIDVRLSDSCPNYSKNSLKFYKIQKI